MSLDLLFLGTPLTGGGGFQVPAPLPQALPGGIYTQWLVTDPVNPLGFVLSDARSM